MLQQEIEFAIDWLDNGGLPWFMGAIMLFYFIAQAVIRWLPVEDVDAS